jgi:hypothetical protein
MNMRKWQKIWIQGKNIKIQTQEKTSPYLQKAQ